MLCWFLWKFPLGFFIYNRSPISNLLDCWTVMEMGCAHCWSEELPRGPLKKRQHLHEDLKDKRVEGRNISQVLEGSA